MYGRCPSPHVVGRMKVSVAQQIRVNRVPCAVQDGHRRRYSARSTHDASSSVATCRRRREAFASQAGHGSSWRRRTGSSGAASSTPCAHDARDRTPQRTRRQQTAVSADTPVPAPAGQPRQTSADAIDHSLCARNSQLAERSVPENRDVRLGIDSLDQSRRYRGR